MVESFDNLLSSVNLHNMHYAETNMLYSVCGGAQFEGRVIYRTDFAVMYLVEFVNDNSIRYLFL